MTQSKNTCRSEFTVPSKAYVIDPGTAQDLYQVTVRSHNNPKNLHGHLTASRNGLGLPGLLNAGAAILFLI